MKTLYATELEEAIRFAMTGEADPDILRHIAAESARIREKLRARYGKLDVAVSLVREARQQ